MGSRYPWRTVIALVVILVGTLLNWSWHWGVLLLVWAWTDLKTGESFLVERITRRQHPILHWAILVLWVAMGVWLLVATSP